MVTPLPAVRADRPRERLLALGAEALTSTELLAVLLGTGAPGQDVMAVAHRLLEADEWSLRRLAARSPSSWRTVPGVGTSKGARLSAAFALAERLAREARPALPRLRCPADVHRLLSPRLRDLRVEEFHILALDTQAGLLRDVLVTRGLLDSSLVHPREVFRAALAEAAAGIILYHNHPSGDPSPSPDDVATTRQLVEAGRILGVPVFDHVIIAGDHYTSFVEQGLL